MQVIRISKRLVKLDCKPTISGSNTNAILATLYKNNTDVHDMRITFLLRSWQMPG